MRVFRGCEDNDFYVCQQSYLVVVYFNYTFMREFVYVVVMVVIELQGLRNLSTRLRKKFKIACFFRCVRSFGSFGFIKEEDSRSTFKKIR